MRTTCSFSLLLFINFVAVWHIAAQENKFNSTIVIDPGHGGKDPGAHFGSLKEKDMVHDISMKASTIIQKMDKKNKRLPTKAKPTYSYQSMPTILDHQAYRVPKPLLWGYTTTKRICR